MKYLGVIIDDKFNFDSNTNYIIEKAAKKVNLIGRRSNKLITKSKILLYKSLVTRHFDYCSSILFLANARQFQDMQKIQNKMMRIVLRCPNSRHAVNIMLAQYQATNLLQHTLDAIKDWTSKGFFFCSI
jgi:hypothetical protein